jgi:hypothetical protein
VRTVDVAQNIHEPTERIPNEEAPDAPGLDDRPYSIAKSLFLNLPNESSTSIDKSGTGVPEPPWLMKLILHGHLRRAAGRSDPLHVHQQNETEDVAVELLGASGSAVGMFATMRRTFMGRSEHTAELVQLLSVA